MSPSQSRPSNGSRLWRKLATSLARVIRFGLGPSPTAHTVTGPAALAAVANTLAAARHASAALATARPLAPTTPLSQRAHPSRGLVPAANFEIPIRRLPPPAPTELRRGQATTAPRLKKDGRTKFVSGRGDSGSR